MEAPFKKMVEEHPDVQITLHKHDPNASSSEIIMTSSKKSKPLTRKSDLEDKIVVDGSQENQHIDTDYNETPHRYSNALDEENIMTHKSDRDFNGFADASTRAYPQDGDETKLPVVNYFVPLVVSTSSIMDVFQQTSKQQKFQVIEKEDAFSTAVFKEAFSLKSYIFKCIPVWGNSEDDSVSAVRVFISVNEEKSCRKVTLKGLYGNFKTIRMFFKFFNRKIQSKLSKGINKPKAAKKKDSGKLNFENNLNEISLISEEETKEDGSQNAVADTPNQKFTYYYYHKILSSDQYSLGKKVGRFCDSFNSAYNMSEEGKQALPKPMNEACSITNEIVKDLYSNYNISGNNKNLMQFCRSSVEKYIFGKIYTKLFEMYKLKYEETDQEFNKRSLVTKATDPVSMLKHLGINKKYIIIDGFTFSNSNSKYEFESKLNESGESSNNTECEDASDYSTPRQEPRNWEGGQIPYHEAIKALERISSFTSPREKLD